MRKKLLLIISICIFILLILPRSVFSAEVKIETKPGQKYIIKEPLVIGPDDVLEIKGGSQIEILSGAYIYVRGKMFIGISDDLDEKDDTTKITVFGSQTGIQVNGGKLLASNLEFEGQKFMNAFNGAHIDITGSTLHDSRAKVFNHSPLAAFISIFNTSGFHLSFSSIDSLNTTATSSFSNSQLMRSSLIETYSYSSSTLEHVIVHSDISKSVLATYLNSNTTLAKTQMHTCHRWFVVYGSSRISGDVSKANCTVEAPEVFGNSTLNIAYDYEPCCSSVLFIPGLQASRLYSKHHFENQLWEPNREADIEKLFLDEHGESRQSGIYTKNIIEKTNILGPIVAKPVYESFIQFLNSLIKDNLIQEYRSFPYDWRFAPDTIFAKHDLIPTIESLAKKSKTGKVTIIAHSYGGLVTKYLLSKMALMGKSDLIDNVIMVGVPESGSPKALFAFLQGYGQISATNFIMNAHTMMNLAKNMPAAYALLPSQIYAKPLSLFFKSKKDTFFSEYLLPKPIQVSGAIDWIRSKIKESGEAGFVPIDPNITHGEDRVAEILSTANPKLQSRALTLHSDFFDHEAGLWDQYKTWSFIGTNIQTPTGMHYVYSTCRQITCFGTSKLIAWPFYSVDGDGTVILDSLANRLGTTTVIDLERLNISRKTNIGHMRLLESDDVQHMIRQVMVSGYIAAPEPFIIDQGNMPKYDRYFERFRIEGNVVGGIKVEYDGKVYTTEVLKNKDTFQLIEDIPNSSIQVASNQIEIMSPVKATGMSFSSLENQRINIEIEDLHLDESRNLSGFLSGNSGEVENISTSGTDSNHAYYYFENIPLTRNAIISLDAEHMTLSVDTDADKVGDKVYHPVIDTKNISSTTSNSFSTSSTSSSASTPITSPLIEKLDILLNHFILQKDGLHTLTVSSLRKTYIKRLDQISLDLRTISIRLQNQSNMSMPLKTKELRALRQNLQIMRDSINRLKQLEYAYDKIIVQSEGLLSDNTNQSARNKALARKANAELYLGDLSRLYLAYTSLGDELLEFYARQW